MMGNVHSRIQGTLLKGDHTARQVVFGETASNDVPWYCLTARQEAYKSASQPLEQVGPFFSLGSVPRLLWHSHFLTGLFLFEEYRLEPPPSSFNAASKFLRA